MAVGLRSTLQGSPATRTKPSNQLSKRSRFSRSTAMLESSYWTFRNLACKQDATVSRMCLKGLGGAGALIGSKVPSH